MLRIATFNVENLDLPPKAQLSIAARAEVLRPVLERLDADILCLQEVNGQHVPGRPERVLVALDQLLAGTRYATYERAATTAASGSGVADVHNLVTLSRAPIVSKREVRHALLPAADVALVTAEPRPQAKQAATFDRPLLVTEHETGGKRLTVVNLHLRAPLAASVPGQKASAFLWKSVGGWAEGFYLSGLKRSGQALELRLLVDQLLDAEPQRLIAVAGDFNAEDHETPLKIAVGAPEDTGNAELTAKALVVLDRALDSDRRWSVLHHGRPQMLDHILASRALYGHFRSIDVHNEALGDEAVAFGKHAPAAGSYHAAVVAAFAL
jgi:endonuclease/exonuclease/phosphatase family metal-dependent hydrolase